MKDVKFGWYSLLASPAIFVALTVLAVIGVSWGLFLATSLTISALGVIFGIVSLVRREKRKWPAVVGILLSVGMLFTILTVWGWVYMVGATLGFFGELLGLG